jgi:hypothetical protein
MGEVKPRLDVRAFAGWYLDLCRRGTYELVIPYDILIMISEILGEAPHDLQFYLKALPPEGIRYIAHWDIERLREGVWRRFGVDYAEWEEEVADRLPERLKDFDKKLAAKALKAALRNAEKEGWVDTLRDIAEDIGICRGDECNEIKSSDVEKHAETIVEKALSILELNVERIKRILTTCTEGDAEAMRMIAHLLEAMNWKKKDFDIFLLHALLRDGIIREEDDLWLVLPSTGIRWHMIVLWLAALAKHGYETRLLYDKEKEMLIIDIVTEAERGLTPRRKGLALERNARGLGVEGGSRGAPGQQ